MPWRKPSRIAPSSPKRNSATANEPIVSVVRIFLRLQVGEEQRQELHDAHLALRLSGLDQHALVEVQLRARALGGARVVGHHQDRLAAIRDEQRQQVQDLVGALAVEVARRLVAQQEGRVGHDRARDRDALLLPARELAREVVHAILEPHDAERGLDALAPLGLRERREEQRQLDVLRKAVSTGIRL